MIPEPGKPEKPEAVARVQPWGTPIVVGSARELDALLALSLFGFGWVRYLKPGSNGGRCLFPAHAFEKAQAGELVDSYPFAVPATGDEPLMLDYDREVPWYTGEDWSGMSVLLRNREGAGWHWLLKTPFEPGEPYWAGLTPQGASGWNGVPDFYCSAPTLPIAVGLVALASAGLNVRYWPRPGEPDPAH